MKILPDLAILQMTAMRDLSQGRSYSSPTCKQDPKAEVASTILMHMQTRFGTHDVGMKLIHGRQHLISSGN